MSITKEDFQLCMQEKDFQSVLEKVAHQRSLYREERVQQREQKVSVACESEVKVRQRSAPSAIVRTPLLIHRARIISFYDISQSLPKVEQYRADHTDHCLDYLDPILCRFGVVQELYRTYPTPRMYA